MSVRMAPHEPHLWLLHVGFCRQKPKPPTLEVEGGGSDDVRPEGLQNVELHGCPNSTTAPEVLSHQPVEAEHDLSKLELCQHG